VDTLSSKNIVLRPFRSDDCQQFAAAIRESAKSVGKWLPWWKPDFSEDDALSWFLVCEEAILARTGFDIGVFRKDGKTLIGSVAINRIDAANRTGSIGYWVRETQQGRGYCSEAVNRIKLFGFNELGLSRLEIVVLTENTASRKVAEKCGAILEYIAENKLVHCGEPSPAAVYSLLP